MDTVTFSVKFKPLKSWVDEIYLGNLLTESLGVLAKQTGSFEFEIEAQRSKPVQ